MLMLALVRQSILLLVIAGADVSNYTVTDQSSTTADISAKVLTATASASDKTYDGGTTATTTLTFIRVYWLRDLGSNCRSTFDNIRTLDQ